MRKRFPNILAAGLLAATLAATIATPMVASAQSKDAVADGAMPKVGEMAPDFTLHYFDGNSLKEVKLSDYRGKKQVLLAFFIFAFTGG